MALRWRVRGSARRSVSAALGKTVESESRAQMVALTLLIVLRKHQRRNAVRACGQEPKGTALLC
eukprot:5708107-Pyramimonas_sp.AAC.1